MACGCKKPAEPKKSRSHEGDLRYLVGTTTVNDRGFGTLSAARAWAKSLAKHNHLRNVEAYAVIEKLKVPNRLCFGSEILEKWTTNTRGTPVKVGGKRS